MAKYVKVVLLLFLIGLSIILSSAIFALEFIHNRRKAMLYKFQKERYLKKKNEKETQNHESDTHLRSLYNDDDDDYSDYSDFDDDDDDFNDIFDDIDSSDDTTDDININNKIKNNINNKISPNKNKNNKKYNYKLSSDLNYEEDKLSLKQVSPFSKYHLHSQISKPPPESNKQISLSAESHLALALRHIPFEAVSTSTVTSTSNGNGDSSKFTSSTTSSSSSSNNNNNNNWSGNALPAELKHGLIVANHDLKLHKRGVDFVKLLHATEENDDGRYDSSSSSSISSSSSSSSAGTNKVQPKRKRKYNLISYLRRKFNRNTLSHDQNKNQQQTSQTNNNDNNDNNDKQLYQQERTTLYHLQQASELGNPYAQNTIANILSSGILPFNNDYELRKALNVTMDVPSDFSFSESGGESHTTTNGNGNGAGSSDSGSGSGSNGGVTQLQKAILLWHMSAMEGNIESLLALGYRHYISATSTSSSSSSIISHNTMIMDQDLLLMDQQQSHPTTSPSSTSSSSSSSSSPSTTSSSLSSSSSNTQPQPQPQPQPNHQINTIRHSPNKNDHYGVLGTCQSALTYYEEAANHIMDEITISLLRGKASPAIDKHILPEIYQRGASSALSQDNKPDELDDAIKFMELRALKVDDPDLFSSYKLGVLYHYGLRGVKQDLRLALKYYEIGAKRNSWESAGQAGKFYLFGMGMEDDQRDLKKAFSYFQIGMPAGITGCEQRFWHRQEHKIQKKKFKNRGVDVEEDEVDVEEAGGTDGTGSTGSGSGSVGKNGKKSDDKARGRDNYNDDEEDDEEEFDLYDMLQDKIPLCDHPSINGMGLLHVFGVPNVVEVNLKTAIRHFELARKMGNMDAMYNLAMMRMGWMNPYYSQLFRNSMFHNNDFESKMNISPSTFDIIEATRLFSDAAELGHIQAKHRLAMIYSRGFKVNDLIQIKSDCPKALALYKDLATNTGTTVTKRMRAAYKQYINGDYESSLRNYLVAAETGSIEAQVNAAFLLEEGYCLGLNHLQCMKASVRLWRAAARMGNEEACLRVGDFYFYGRLREDVSADVKNNIIAQRDAEYAFTPIPLLRYVLYPEDILSKAWTGMIHMVRRMIEKDSSTSRQTSEINHEPFCVAGEANEDEATGTGTCKNEDIQEISSWFDRKNEFYTMEQKEHFKIAAKYYHKAAEEMHSARAHYNLGYMHEWGLGLNQDFPLAKRHYDLAAEKAQGVGDGLLANQIALTCMNIHEIFVKIKSLHDSWLVTRVETQNSNPTASSSTHSLLGDENVLHSATEQLTNAGLTTRSGIIIHHVLSWESAIILLLAVVLFGLIQYRNTRHVQR